MWNKVVKAIRYFFRDRSSTLEEYILSRNPQTPHHVEQLEREYHMKMSRLGLK